MQQRIEQIKLDMRRQEALASKVASKQKRFKRLQITLKKKKGTIARLGAAQCAKSAQQDWSQTVSISTVPAQQGNDMLW